MERPSSDESFISPLSSDSRAHLRSCSLEVALAGLHSKRYLLLSPRVHLNGMQKKTYHERLSVAVG